MLVSHDPKIIDFVRQTRDYDTILDAHPHFNFQMTDLQAAVGRCQLAKLPEFLTRRENIFPALPRNGGQAVGCSHFGLPANTFPCHHANR